MTKSFVVAGDKFYDLNADYREVFGADRRRLCEKAQPAIGRLVERFDLAGKSVVSVGAGSAFEEFGFWKAGCKLTLVDIDEYGSLAKLLPTILAADSAPATGTIRYILGDARNLGDTNDQFDVCYFSSLTPDELRRRDIQASYRSRARWFINGVARRVIGRGVLPTWPPDAPPYDEIVQSTTKQLLAPGGLFVHQSYAFSVDVASNPHWISLIQRQLADWGVQLISFYTLHPLTTVSLAIGLRGSADEARQLTEKIRDRPEIDDFHVRYTEPHSVRRWL